MENWEQRMNSRKSIFTDFAQGIIVGIIFTAIIFSVVLGFTNSRKKSKELLEYAERQQAIEELYEVYDNLDPYEFIEAIPGVSAAVDGAAAEFIRKRDEALERLRSGYFDRRYNGSSSGGD
jgi:hypothetical protein